MTFLHVSYVISITKWNKNTHQGYRAIPFCFLDTQNSVNINTGTAHLHSGENSGSPPTQQIYVCTCHRVLSLKKSKTLKNDRMYFTFPRRTVHCAALQMVPNKRTHKNADGPSFRSDILRDPFLKNI